MAIKMVREPSETPNINNIDDIIPMRYAYGGQNGYVIGKGTEISNTINGSNFIINSGRLVLQGVECDIDATGVTITIDNIATKRYYVIYLQVNLATNIVSVESSYDTADYPVIDSGDDLTENSSGIARMILYKFTAINGIISEVNKIVESVKYINDNFIKNVKVNNSLNSTNSILKYDGNYCGFTKNKEGSLYADNILIRQTINLYKGSINLKQNDSINFTNIIPNNIINNNNIYIEIIGLGFYQILPYDNLFNNTTAYVERNINSVDSNSLSILSINATISISNNKLTIDNLTSIVVRNTGIAGACIMNDWSNFNLFNTITIEEVNLIII